MNAIEVPAESISNLISSIGKGVAEAQKEFDKTLAEIQILAKNDPILSKYDYKPPWYFIPEIDVELKIVLSVVYKRVNENIYKKEIVAFPVNASYSNMFNYNSEYAMSLKMKIVSVPPESRKE